MKFAGKNLMCVSIPEPRSWEMNGQAGVSYKVDLSDGTNTVTMACKNIEVYQIFRPFRPFDVEIELVQTNFDGRKGVKAQISSAKVVEK